MRRAIMGKGDSFFSFADMAMERASHHKHHSASVSAASLDSTSASSTPAGSPASLRRNPSKYAAEPHVWFQGFFSISSCCCTEMLSVTDGTDRKAQPYFRVR